MKWATKKQNKSSNEYVLTRQALKIVQSNDNKHKQINSNADNLTWEMSFERIGESFISLSRWVKTARSLSVSELTVGETSMQCALNCNQNQQIHALHKRNNRIICGTEQRDDAGLHYNCVLLDVQCWAAQKSSEFIQRASKVKEKSQFPVTLSRCICCTGIHSEQYFTNGICIAWQSEAEQMPTVLFNSVGCYWISLRLKC